MNEIIGEQVDILWAKNHHEDFGIEFIVCLGCCKFFQASLGKMQFRLAKLNEILYQGYGGRMV